jgi:hypothetical protein
MTVAVKDEKRVTENIWTATMTALQTTGEKKVKENFH